MATFLEEVKKVKIRKQILDEDLIEAVIGLPSKLFYGTGIPGALLIINKNKPTERKSKIIFINGELEFQEGTKQNKLREEIFKNFKYLQSWKEIKRYSSIISLEEIKENDYNLNIRRYADSSPPPEPYDTKAILNGGIPVSEVEDEYIQETLQGMDVSSVFNRKDKEYFEFKPEIESKEQIEKLPKYSRTAVIGLFEKWWDKYKISIYELDAEVKKSEELMWSYLKELGMSEMVCS